MTPISTNPPDTNDDNLKKSKKTKRKRKISQTETNSRRPKYPKNLEQEELIIKDEIVELNGSPQKTFEDLELPRTYSLSYTPDLTKDEEARNNMILKYKNKTRSNSICSTGSNSPSKRSPNKSLQNKLSENKRSDSEIIDPVILDTSIVDSDDYLVSGQKFNGNCENGIVENGIVENGIVENGNMESENMESENIESEREENVKENEKVNENEKKDAEGDSDDELRVSEEEIENEIPNSIPNETSNSTEKPDSAEKPDLAGKPNDTSLDVEASTNDSDTSDTSIVSDDESDRRIVKKRGRSTIKKIVKENGDEDDFDAVEEYMKRGNLDLPITPSFPVPPQHLIETRLVRAPTRDQRDQFRELGEQMKSGPFNRDEDERIRGNFKRFCEEYNLTPDPQLYLNRNLASNYTNVNVTNATSIAQFSRAQRLNFGRYLARDLPQRYLYSVFGRFQSLHETVVKCGRFTEEEDKSLMEFVKNSSSPNRFVGAAELLGRRKQSVSRRYYALVGNKYDNYSISWNKEEIISLIQALISHCGVSSLDELRDHRITTSIWTKIAQEFSFSPTALRHFWYGRLASQVYATRDYTLNEIRVKLVKLFRKAQIKSARDIRWQEVEKHFDGLTSMFLWQKFDKLVKHRVPDYRSMGFEEILEYLHKEVVPQLKCSQFDRLLRRCTYSEKDGLVFIT